MNVGDFYKALKKTTRSKKFSWKLNNYGSMRKPTIRADLNVNNSYRLCPICAVAFNMTGKLYDNWQWERAAQSIKLRRRDSLRIIKGADGVNSLINDKILVTLGLKENQVV